MDCLEFRRLLGTDPRIAGAAAREHLESCPRCRDAYARAHAFEGRLSQALAVPVPEGLADRVLLNQLTGERQRRATGFRYGWIALAAAASLALAIGLVQRQRASAASIPDLVVAHVNGEEKPMLALRTPVASGEVKDAFTNRGVHLASVPEGVSYVAECPVGKYPTVHMVMPRDNQPVSVLYFPNYRVAAAQDFTRGTQHGREVRVADGTLVMLAENTAEFDALEHTWRNALEGPAQTAAGSR